MVNRNAAYEYFLQVLQIGRLVEISYCKWKVGGFCKLQISIKNIFVPKFLGGWHKF